MRDPKIDPQQGDRVIARNRTRRVLKRNGMEIWYTVEEQGNAHDKCCWITTWQDWCKKHDAKVANDKLTGRANTEG